MNQMQDQRSSNGPRKRQFDGPDRGQAKRPAGIPETLFRLLVPGKRVGSLIGKGGSIIKQMREETGARITVADAPPVSSGARTFDKWLQVDDLTSEVSGNHARTPGCHCQRYYLAVSL